MVKISLAGQLSKLLQKHGGLFGAEHFSSPNSDELRMTVRSVEMGNVGFLWPEVGKREGPTTSIRASGSGLDEQTGLIPAFAEGLERYSMCVFRNEQFVWATAEELGVNALDLDTIPRCSRSERSHSKCPLTLPDKSKKIRWVRGLSLLDNRIVFVPAVMVYSHIGYAVPEERFWIPISTGCAAHESYEQALLAGIYEVAERDAICITWLHQLSLPRIELDCIPLSLAPYWERYLKAPIDIKYLFYDATTDLGIPTVYSLQIAQFNSKVTTLVSCATGLTIVDAVAKVIRDMAAIRLSFKKERRIPDSQDDFTDLLHGATFMARAESASAFRFLTDTNTVKRLSEYQYPRSENYSLLTMIKQLRQKHLSVYVIDISTDEAIRSGMRVVRVIIPGLQPLSFRHRARFLGHPRLYSAPIAMGYKSHPEEELNPWPQPFA